MTKNPEVYQNQLSITFAFTKFKNMLIIYNPLD